MSYADIRGLGAPADSIDPADADMALKVRWRPGHSSRRKLMRTMTRLYT